MTPTRSTRALRFICLLLVAIGLLASGYGLVRRIAAERSSRAVEVVLDYPEMQALADRQGVSVQDVLIRMRDAGATAVALPEETLATLEDAGLVTLTGKMDHVYQLNGKSLFPTPHDADPIFTIIADTAVSGLVSDGLNRAFSKNNIVSYYNAPKTRLFAVRGTKEAVSEFGLGLMPARVQVIQESGLRVIPRLRGQAPRDGNGIQDSLAAVATQLPAPENGKPRGIVIFDGTTIPGYRALLPVTAEALTQNGLVYGCIEFGKQKGDAQLGATLKGQLVRVHSISVEELATMTDVEAIQRFGLAVKDRNIRVLYVHLPGLSSASAITDAGQYVHAIVREIRGMQGMGFTVSPDAPAHPFIPTDTPAWLLLLLFAGAGAGLVFWILSVLPTQLPRGYVATGYVLFALGLVLATAFALNMPAEGRKIFGLVAAVAFPLLSLTWAYHRVDRMVAQHPARSLFPALGALLVATAITLIGAVMIAAMMGETSYLVKVTQFAGVKAALAIPLLIFAAIIVTDGIARPGEMLVEYTGRCRENFRTFTGQPLYLWGAIIAVMALAVVGLVLMRSGNDSGMGVSGVELQMRSTLEQWMIARPRTKEFIFGVPMFLFAMVAAARRKRALAMIFLLGAAIGQTDVLNTYCHAHTPVMLSLLRTFNGLWLGAAIGVITLALFARRTAPVEEAKVEVVE